MMIRNIGITVLLVTIGQSFSNTRYIDSVFSQSKVSNSTLYRTANNSVGIPQSLYFDFYEPANDTVRTRPLVIVMHGGAFVKGAGGRDDGFSKFTATYLAKKGYTAASIDYRCEEILQLIAGGKAMDKAAYRAIQDTRAAVRFFKKNANVYKVDTGKIFLCGYSAGAIMALNNIHITGNEFTSIMVDTNGMGGLEVGDDLEYSSSVNGSVCFAGAVRDTAWIKSNAPPSICFHGTVDATVPYESGNAFGYQTMPMLYGSGAVNRISKRIGYNNKLVTYDGLDHSFVDSIPLLESSLDTASFFISSLLGNSAVNDPFLIKRNLKTYGITVSYSRDRFFDLSGRKITGQSKLTHGMHIAVSKNLSGHMYAVKLLNTDDN